MISEIIIHNFQSHKAAELVLSPGINVIVGSSSAGKTSILRALNWALFNSPSGTNFIRKGESDVSVSVVFSDGFAVAHYRTKKNHVYELVTASNENTFEAFGTSVPKEIEALVNMADINIQSQLEPHFLALKSPGEVARFIRKTAGLDDIDSVVSSLYSRMLKANASIVSIDERIAEIDATLEELRRFDLKFIGAALYEYDELKLAADFTRTSARCLTALAVEVKAVVQSIPVLPETFEDTAAALQTHARTWEHMEDRLLSLSGVYRPVKEYEEFLRRFPDTFAGTYEALKQTSEEYLDLAAPFEKLDDILISVRRIGDMPKDPSLMSDKLSALRDEARSVKRKWDGMDACMTEISVYDIQIEELHKQMKALDSTLVGLKSQLTECPTCGQSLSNEAVAHFMKRGSA